jgi:hypothetical protein
MRNAREFIIKGLLLAASAWLTACGGEDGSSGSMGQAQQQGGSAGSSGAGDPAAGGASGTGASGTAGDSTASSGGLACDERPNVFSEARVFNCAYACREGFADCDDSRDNGCETDLSAPDACSRCGLAYSCFMPELCGAPKEVCSEGSIEAISLSLESRGHFELGGFVPDEAGQHFMTLDDIGFESSSQAIELSGGVAFRHMPEMIGTHLWTSLQGPEGGQAPQVERFGDQLVFFGTGDAEVVVSVTDLQGVQRWAAHMPMTDWARPNRVILDADGNLYVWVEVIIGDLTVDDELYDYANGDGFSVLVSYDADGALRWVSSANLPDELWSNAVEEWKDIFIMDDNVAVLRRGEVATFSRADGSYLGGRDLENTFSSFAEGHAFVGTDSAGNFYVASVSNADAMESETPMPNAVPHDDAGADIPERAVMHVTKLSPSRVVIWRRPVLWDDDAYKDTVGIPIRNETPRSGLHIRSFDVTPDGFSWLLGSTLFDDGRWQILVGVTSDGQVAAARYMKSAQEAQVVRTAPDGALYVAGTYEDWQVGDTLFDGFGVFVEKDLFDELAD